MLLTRIDAFLRRSKMSPTRFGREALGDPNFIPNLRAGREPRAPTVRRVVAFLEMRDPRPEPNEAARCE